MTMFYHHQGLRVVDNWPCAVTAVVARGVVVHGSPHQLLEAGLEMAGDTTEPSVET